MEHHYKLFILGFFLLFRLSPLNAQSKSSVSEFMNDGGASSAKNTISTNILSYTRGDIPILYEHRFSKYFSLESGVGIMLPYCLTDFFGSFQTNGSEEYAEETIGYSLLLHSKFFISKDIESPSFGLLCRMRHYGEVTNFGFGVTAEKRWVYWNRISIGVGMDIGFSYQISSSPKSDYIYPDIFFPKATYPDDCFGVLVGLSLKIGFIF